VLAVTAASTLAPTAGNAIETRVLLPSVDRATVELTQADEGSVLRRLELEIGKSLYVQTDYAVKRVSVGNPEILDVVVLSPRELQLVPLEVGGTNLLLWSSRGRPEAALDIQVGTQHRHIQSELRRIFDSEDITVEGTPDGVILRGTVWSAVAMEQALAVAGSFLGEDGALRVVNLLRARGNQQVLLEVIIAEMSKTVARDFGMDFNALIESGGNQYSISSLIQSEFAGLGATGFQQLSSMANLIGFMSFGSTELVILMDILETNGMSRILARPNLISRSGESASFLVGGEVPIPVSQGGNTNTITVEYKKFGVGLNFMPTVLGPDRIHLELATEVSAPDESFGVQVSGTTAPAFNTRQAATSVELSDGQSFAIAGLLREELVEVSAQWPILGNIPIFGALFRSSEFEKRNTEVVIIVTPHLAKPLEPGPPHLPTDHFIEPEAWEFYLFGALESSRLPPGYKQTPYSDPVASGGGIIGDVGPQFSVSQTEGIQ